MAETAETMDSTIMVGNDEQDTPARHLRFALTLLELGQRHWVDEQSGGLPAPEFEFSAEYCALLYNEIQRLYQAAETTKVASATSPMVLLWDGDEVTINRELVGQNVRHEWIAYCREIGDDKPSHLAPWVDLGEKDREADRRIGEKVTRTAIHALLTYMEAKVREKVTEIAAENDRLRHRNTALRADNTRLRLHAQRLLRRSAGQTEGGARH